MRLKVAEAVTPAHPDKVADQISDAILEDALRQDPKSRVAIETMIGHGEIHIMGEVTSDSKVDIKQICRRVLDRCRYHHDDYTVSQTVTRQSSEIAAGVDIGGAGDQGVMVGYACRGNDMLIPHELYLARRILKALWIAYPDRVRDAKAQVALNDDNDIVNVLVSAERMEKSEIERFVRMILDIGDYELICNPAGPWHGGPDADTGLTGRKIVQDAYGPSVPVGGGAFSGKDPSKVDRSAAYAARRMSLAILRVHPEANDVMVRVAYGIGLEEPLAVQAFIDGEPADFGKTHEDVIERLKPQRIIQDLTLLTVPYSEVAAWGSFGDRRFPWEHI